MWLTLGFEVSNDVFALQKPCATGPNDETAKPLARGESNQGDLFELLFLFNRKRSEPPMWLTLGFEVSGLQIV